MAFLVVTFGVVAVATRLDGPSDATLVTQAGWDAHASWMAVDVLEGAGPATQLRSGDEVTAVDGRVLAQGLGRVPRPEDGDSVGYALRSGELRSGFVGPPDVAALLGRSAGDLVFVVAFGLLALALYRRRPAEPAVGPLLVAAAGLFGSTLSVAAGLPVLALAVGGPPVWMYQVSTVVIYSLAWGAVVATSLVFVPGHPWLVPSSAGRPRGRLRGPPGGDGALGDVGVGRSWPIRCERWACWTPVSPSSPRPRCWPASSPGSWRTGTRSSPSTAPACGGSPAAGRWRP